MRRNSGGTVRHYVGRWRYRRVGVDLYEKTGQVSANPRSRAGAGIPLYPEPHRNRDLSFALALLKLPGA